MLSRPDRAARTRSPLARLGVLTLAVGQALWGLPLQSAQAWEGGAIVRVEEDWELVVQDPDPETQAPQVTCVISPVGDADGTHAVFDLNLRTRPDVQAGGMQLELWHGEQPLTSAKSHSGTLLHHHDETVRWTVEMSVGDGLLRVKVKDGQSESWGSFGGGTTLQVTKSTELEHLGSYLPSVSTANSGVGFASNRVGSLVLKRVRAYSSAGLVWENNSPQVVYSHD